LSRTIVAYLAQQFKVGRGRTSGGIPEPGQPISGASSSGGMSVSVLREKRGRGWGVSREDLDGV
jgi:hypothetical protein